MDTTRVGLPRADNRKANVRQALELLREDIEPKLAEQIALKPNFLTV